MEILNTKERLNNAAQGAGDVVDL